MTNRDKLLKVSVYDLLVKLNSNCLCVIENLDNLTRSQAMDRCDTYGTCEECIQHWLNEGDDAKKITVKTE